MATIIKTKKGTHIITTCNRGTIKADVYVHDNEIMTFNEALKYSRIVIGKNICGDYELNQKKDIICIKKTSFNKITINAFCIIDAITVDTLIINSPCLIINSEINQLIINQPKNQIILKNNIINCVKITNLGIYDFSLHLENNELLKQINLQSFFNHNTNTTIYFNHNKLHIPIHFDSSFTVGYQGTVTIYHNYYLGTGELVDTIYPDGILFKDNYIYQKQQLIYLDNEQYTKYTGYNQKYIQLALKPFQFLDYQMVRKTIDIPKYQRLNVENIPQYISNPNDPALMVGCEATACAIAVSYLLKQKITKNTLATYMPQAKPNEKSFWEAFIGDIYQDGWGCMSSVSVITLQSFLKAHQLENKYEVLNLTNTSLYDLFPYLSNNLPIIVWATMGNEHQMEHKKYGSTIFNLNDKPLYWPGRDHCLVIAGYNLLTNEIFLADPEQNNTLQRTRNILEFENRFAELYSQSIVIIPKIEQNV